MKSLSLLSLLALTLSLSAQLLKVEEVSPMVQPSIEPFELEQELDKFSESTNLYFHAKDYELNQSLSSGESAADGYYYRLQAKDFALRVFLEIKGLVTGDTLYVLNDHGRKVESLHADKLYQPQWSTSLYKDELTLYYANHSGQQPKVTIISYSLELAKTTSTTEDFGDSDFCEVNVNCEEGNGHQDEKNGVARVLIKNGSLFSWCTGSLINNTARDCRMLFLTAEHCGLSNNNIFASAADLNRWVFYFNYETPTCADVASESEINDVRVTGARVLARSNDGGGDEGSDFLLLELNNTLPVSYQPYFLGWNRVDNGANGGVVIHQPNGDVKKISTFSQSAISGEYGAINFDTHWLVRWVPTTNGHGVTEPGSSGSTLLDENGLIVGALTGGSASCNNPTLEDYFGKLSYSWTSNGNTDNTRLRPWLDPLNSGVQVLAGSYCGDSVARPTSTYDVLPTLLDEDDMLKIVGGNGIDIIQVHIFDMQGRRNWSSERFAPLAGNTLEVDLSELASGMYVVRITGDNVDQETRIMKIK